MREVKRKNNVRLLRFIIAAICFMVLFLLLLVAVLHVFAIPKSNVQDRERVRSFYKLDKETVDVLLQGASTTYRGWNAMEAWDKFGISSYAYATSAEPPTLRNFICSDALKRQTPKVFIFDYTEYTDALTPTTQRLGALRKATDAMPFGINRAEAIKYSLDTMGYKGDRFKFYFGFYEYHNTYKIDFTKDNFTKRLNDTGGVYIGSDIFRVNKVTPDENLMNKTGMTELSIIAKKALMDTIEYIKLTKIDALFVLYPRTFKEGQREKYNTVEKILAENDIPYLDLTKKIDEIGIDYNTDFKDEGKHVNFEGAIKTTDYLCEYLKKEYGLQDHSGDEKYKQFDTAYKNYEEKVKQYTK